MSLGVSPRRAAWAHRSSGASWSSASSGTSPFQAPEDRALDLESALQKGPPCELARPGRNAPDYTGLCELPSTDRRWGGGVSGEGGPARRIRGRCGPGPRQAAVSRSGWAARTKRAGPGELSRSAVAAGAQKDSGPDLDLGVSAAESCREGPGPAVWVCRARSAWVPSTGAQDGSASPGHCGDRSRTTGSTPHPQAKSRELGVFPETEAVLFLVQIQGIPCPTRRAWAPRPLRGRVSPPKFLAALRATRTAGAPRGPQRGASATQLCAARTPSLLPGSRKSSGNTPRSKLPWPTRPDPGEAAELPDIVVS
ncbi:uncharacterized protein LOC119537298 [Choloepus didactylus]|uniref:uncharacterized protein LOC119537298 n=1 Tax=Choloepus didactylus TaxID=27675 RepID=UPI0018A06951|nr:uncharacterized protein LOC119537298 [Choloepus didactylus]